MANYLSIGQPSRLSSLSCPLDRPRARGFYMNVPLVQVILFFLMALTCWVMPASALAPLVQSTDMQYVGAFRVPSETSGGSIFEYGGTRPAYNSGNNSLFLVGHDWQQQVAEISIPAPSKSTLLSDLPTAAFLQPFKDPSAGKMYTVGTDTTKVGGLLVYQGKLIGSAYVYYDGSGAQILSHWYNDSTSLSSAAHGMYQAGSLMAGYVSGYMGTIPPEWQSALGGPALTGNCCIPVISRTSFGPAVSVFNPASLGVTNPAPASPLVYYPQSNPIAAYDATSNLFNGSTQITGVVFPEGTRSVLFFGRQGQGPFCYGPGTSDQSLAGTPAPGGVDLYCYDPTDASKGTHSYPYAYQVWAYDVNDLVAVKAGQKQPWAIRPYVTWNLTLPFGNDSALLGGAAWDPQTRRLYLSILYADDVRPVIHVLTIGGASSVTPPAAPTNFLVR